MAKTETQAAPAAASEEENLPQPLDFKNDLNVGDVLEGEYKKRPIKCTIIERKGVRVYVLQDGKTKTEHTSLTNAIRSVTGNAVTVTHFFRVVNGTRYAKPDTTPRGPKAEAPTPISAKVKDKAEAQAPVPAPAPKKRPNTRTFADQAKEDAAKAAAAPAPKAPAKRGKAAQAPAEPQDPADVLNTPLSEDEVVTIDL